MPTQEFIQVTTTIDSPEKAQTLADAILKQRLAACVQVSGPIQSAYWWHHELEHASEWMLSIKTPLHCYPALETFIQSNHPYETPEIIALPIIGGSRAYLDWIAREATQP